LVDGGVSMRNRDFEFKFVENRKCTDFKFKY
jgi:hypothetical protein